MYIILILGQWPKSYVRCCPSYPPNMDGPRKSRSSPKSSVPRVRWFSARSPSLAEGCWAAIRARGAGGYWLSPLWCDCNSFLNQEIYSFIWGIWDEYHHVTILIPYIHRWFIIDIMKYDESLLYGIEWNSYQWDTVFYWNNPIPLRFNSPIVCSLRAGKSQLKWWVNLWTKWASSTKRDAKLADDHRKKNKTL